MDLKHVLTGLICIVGMSSSEQNYGIEIEKLVLLPQTDPSWVNLNFTLRSTKIGRNTFAINGGLDILKNLGNDVEMALAIYKKDKLTDKFYPTPMYIKKGPICKMYDENSFIDQMIAASNIPPRGTCPIPKGNYAFNNYKLEPDSFPNVIPPGEYKILVTVTQDQQSRYAHELHFSVVKD